MISIAPHDKDLGGGFRVRRLLPSVQRRSIGPFVFFDHFGPAQEAPGMQHDVRPHPHIGLATVTYLFDGGIFHRDSIGSEQLIEPGAINWMTAGRGIAHSERKPAAWRERTYTNHGLQLWVALPREREECEPAFEHTPAAAIPEVKVGDARVRVLVGDAFGARSPVQAASRTLYLDVQLPAGSGIELPAGEAELALYPIDAALSVDGEPLAMHTMAVLRTDGPTQVFTAGAPARFVVIGGDALDGPRTVWWNFVSSRKERVAQAARDWEAGRFAKVPGDDEFIPLPANGFVEPGHKTIPG